MTFLSTTTCNQTSNNNSTGQDNANGSPQARSENNAPWPPGITLSIVILRGHPQPEAIFQEHVQRDEYQNLDTTAAIEAALRIARGEDDDILSLRYATKDHHGHSTGDVKRQ